VCLFPDIFELVDNITFVAVVERKSFSSKLPMAQNDDVAEAGQRVDTRLAW
jgi:hypothetical protein